MYGHRLSLTHAYAHNASNEYTELVTNSVTQGYTYDLRGNLSRDEGLDNASGADYLEYDYDIEDRLTKVGYDPDGSSLTLIAMADYRYDALGRRIEFIDHVRGITTRYYHDGQSIVAEYTYSQSTESPAREYVNGSQYIDERAVLRDVADPENPEEHYYLLKDLYTVTGLAGSNGLLEEAYVYDTYGQAVIHAWPVGDVNRDGLVEADGGANNADLDAILAYVSQGDEPRVDLAGPNNGPPDGSINIYDVQAAQANDTATPTTLTYSGLGNPFLFTGRLTDTLGADALEAASDPDGFRRVQDNRNRIYIPGHGRWLQREPLGVRPDPPAGRLEPVKQYTDGMSVYEYVGSRPMTGTDPEGLFWYPIPPPIPPSPPRRPTRCMNPGITEYQHNYGVRHKGLLVGGRDVDFGPGHWASYLGVCPWPGNAANTPSPANTNYMRGLSVRWSGRLRLGRARGKRCCAATCVEIQECVNNACGNWNGTRYGLLTRNCYDFVSSTKNACCLN